MAFGQPAVSVSTMIIIRCSTGISLTFIKATVVEILAASDAGALLGGLDKFNIMVISINLEPDKIRMREQDTRTQNKCCLWDYPYHLHRRLNHIVLHYHRCSIYRWSPVEYILLLNPPSNYQLPAIAIYHEDSHWAYFPPLYPRAHRYSDSLQKSSGRSPWESLSLPEAEQ